MAEELTVVSEFLSDLKEAKERSEGMYVAALYRNPSLYLEYELSNKHFSKKSPWAMYYSIFKAMDKRGIEVFDALTTDSFVNDNLKEQAKVYYSSYGNFSPIQIMIDVVEDKNILEYYGNVLRYSAIFRLSNIGFDVEGKWDTIQKLDYKELADFFDGLVNDVFTDINMEEDEVVNLTDDMRSVWEAADKGINAGLPVSSNLLNNMIKGQVTGHLTLVGGRSGEGKAMPVDTLIPTPDGDRLLGDIEVGDYVYDRLGNPTKVTGVFPQGFIDSYKVELLDGRSTFCNDQHLWSVHEGFGYSPRNSLKTVTTRHMISQGLLDDKGNYKYTIPNYSPDNDFDFGVKIKNISYTGRKEDMVCIMVDNPEHLYLANDYIVTHNTFLTTCLTLPTHIKHSEPLLIMCNEEDVKTWKMQLTIWAANNVVRHTKEFKDSDIFLLKERYFDSKGGFTQEEWKLIDASIAWLDSKIEAEDIKFVNFNSFSMDKAIGLIKKYATQRNFKYFILDTMKADNDVGSNVSDLAWLHLQQGMVKLYNVIKESNKNVHVWITYQLRKENRKFLDMESLGMSKNVVDVVSTLILVRNVYDSEKNDNNLRVRGNNNQDVILSPDNDYMLCFVPKNRRGSTNDVVVLKTDKNKNIVTDIGLTRIAEDF